MLGFAVLPPHKLNQLRSRFQTVNSTFMDCFFCHLSESSLVFKNDSALLFCMYVFRFVTPDQKYKADNTPHTPTPFKNALEKYGPIRPLVCIEPNYGSFLCLLLIPPLD